MDKNLNTMGHSAATSSPPSCWSVGRPNILLEWVDDFTVGGKTYHSFQGRGAGGQFIFMFPELDLVAVITFHNKGMGDTLQTLPQRIIPASVK